MTYPQGMRGKLAALAILVVVLILAREFVVGPASRYFQGLDDDILDMQLSVTQLEKLLSRTPALSATASRLEADNPLAAITLEGENAALAAANLQQFIQKTATRNGAHIVSLQVRPMETLQSNLERITVETRLRTGVAGLRKLLFDLETSTRYLFVERLALRALATRQRKEAHELDVTLEVYGLRKRETSQAETGA